MNQKITYYVTPEQYQALRKEAFDRSITISSLLREILENWLRFKDIKMVFIDEPNVKVTGTIDSYHDDSELIKKAMEAASKQYPPKE